MEVMEVMSEVRVSLELGVSPALVLSSGAHVCFSSLLELHR